MPKYYAINYVRLSYNDDKTCESDSVINQKRYIDDFVQKNPDIEVVDIKVDDGYSGIVFDRPAFKEMMEDIRSGKINCVIVKDLSRLGREYCETFTYLRKIFPALGVRFIAINDHIDTAKEAVANDLTVSVKGVMNDEYCRILLSRTELALVIPQPIYNCKLQFRCVERNILSPAFNG